MAIPRTRIIPVGENIFCVQRKAFLSYSYFLRRPRGVVMVDTGIDDSAGDMLDAMRAVGLDPASIYAILITHWHNDHTSGIHEIQRIASPRIYDHAAARERMMREHPRARWRGWLARRVPEHSLLAPFRGLLDAAPSQAVEADQFVSEGDLVEDEFRVIETPGHEAGHVAYHFTPEEVLFCGDALAAVDNRVSFMSRYLTADRDEARASMLRCIEMAPKAFCPGHRYPLVDPAPTHLESMTGKLRKSFRWPVVGR